MPSTKKDAAQGDEEGFHSEPWGCDSGKDEAAGLRGCPCSFRASSGADCAVPITAVI